MRGGVSIFDSITCDDLVIAFFPCIYFCDAKTLAFKGVSISQKNWDLGKIMEYNITMSINRHYYFQTLLKFVSIFHRSRNRLVIENPYNPSGNTFLQCNFINPTIIDKDRTRRGDYFIKPTAYWFVNCENTIGYSYQKDKKKKSIMSAKRSLQAGICSEERSIIHPDYARNFICDFIIGKTQKHTQLTLF